MLVTRKSDPNKPCRVMIYGVEGVGKSTFGAMADAPVFITPEGGTDRLVNATGAPVDEMPNVGSWDAVEAAIGLLLTEKHEHKTLVIDSADWLEKLCHAKIIADSKKSIITCNGGYGTGYRESEILHRKLIERLSLLREGRGMNIIVTAHAHVKPVKDPEMLEDYDCFEIKCHEMVSSLWREWVDALFFVRFRTFVKASEDTARARALGDDTRVLYTVKRPAFQAKNRYGMKPEYDFTKGFWEEFKKLAKPIEETLEQVQAEIIDLEKYIKDEKTKKIVAESIVSAKNQLSVLIPIRNRLKEVTGRK